uniref:Uncharacterized protein AlNc14C118G6597 n=1 Tax=Albugo laibachii Nc14 TaxID=890382 RepID=F0WJ65_9STRA|nr:conserved hypothetical protein [Albugo laibachii Nc14]|eukprot:CCA21312.1 conserved hypothetical protein [Albugo laibachii Nc14]
MEYEIEWDKGPLGLTLCPDFGEDMPPVVGRVMPTKSAAYKSKAAPGHLLVSINGIDTAGKGYDNIVKLLKNIPRPVYLRFRVPNGFHVTRSKRNAEQTLRIPSMNQEQYTILWMDGPLGIILRPDDKNKLIPCVYKRKRQGRGLGLDKVSIGDQLIAINGKETRYLGLRQSVSMLTTIQKPVVLKFYKVYRKKIKDHMTQTTPPDATYNYFKLIWYGGELGLKLKATSNSELPVISRFTGKGSVEGILLARAGDELVHVNGHSVREKGYQDIVRMMKQSKKPVVLEFRHRKGNPSLDDCGPADNPAEDDFHSAEVTKYISDTRPSTLSSLLAEEISHSRQGSTIKTVGMPFSGYDSSAGHTSPKISEKELIADVTMSRVFQESKVLQEALETIKIEAKKYENILQSQSTQRIIASAIHNKPVEIVGKQNCVIAELTNAVSGLKRESYSDLDIPCSPLEIERHGLMEGLQNVMNISVVVPKVASCAECGITEKESKLDPDEHGQLYCDDCWNQYRAMNDQVSADPCDSNYKIISDVPETQSDTDESGSKESIDREICELDKADPQAREDTVTDFSVSTDVAMSSSRVVSASPIEQVESRDSVLDELTQALLEEEDRARAEGNEALAEKLKIQRLRAREPLSLRSIQSLPNDILRDDLKKGIVRINASSERFMRSDDPFQHQFSSSLLQSSLRMSGEADNVDDVSIQVMEESNFALARQVQEAHNLVQRARLSIIPTGEYTQGSDIGGLSEAQIQLFKKLTSQLDERMSTVDRLHPPDDSDSSDSESDSDPDGVWI